MAGHSTDATSETRLTAAEKREKCLQLRRAGMSYREIGRQVGCSPAAAFKHVKKTLEALNEEIQREAVQVRALELDRLDRAQRSIWPDVLKGKLGAIDRFLKISERRAKLTGMDSPELMQLLGHEGGPLEIRRTIVDPRSDVDPASDAD